MAQYVLLNTVRVGTQTHYQGEVFDTINFDIAPILAVGGQLVPASAQALAWAASIAGMKRGGQGADGIPDPGYPLNLVPSSNIAIWGAQRSWTIDPIGGNDSNVGNSTAPLKTWGEFIRRYGAILSISATTSTPFSIHWVNDQVDQTDPVSVVGSMRNSPFTMDGALIQVGSGVFSTVTTINRAGNVAFTGTVTGGASNFWTPFLGMLVHDTTSGAWFCVDKDLGTAKGQFTRAFSGPTVSWPSNVAPGTIANGDAFVIYRFPKVYAGEIDIAFDDSFNIFSTATVSHLHFGTNTGSDFGVQANSHGTGYVVFQECLFDGTVSLHSDVYEQLLAVNCYFTGTATLDSVSMFGGGVANLNAVNNTVVDADAIVHGTPEIVGDVSFNCVYLDGELDIPFYGLAVPSAGSIGVSLFNSGFGVAALWGPATLKLHPNGRLFYDSPAASWLLLKGALTIDGLTTGAKIAPGPFRLVVDGIAITPGNIDSTAGGWSTGIYSSQSGAGIIPFAPTTGSMPLNFVYIDPVNGSDTNQGGYATSQATPAPLKTWAEFERRVSRDPTLYISPVIQIMSSPASPTLDPIRWTPFMQRAAWLLIGTRTLITTGTLGVGTSPRNQTTGATTHVDLSAFPAAAVGMQVENTTAGKASLAIISASLGAGIFEVYQPLTQAPAGPVSSYVPGPFMVNTWASGDTFNLWQFPSVSILESGGVGGQYIPPNFPCSTIRWLHIVSPDGPSEANFLLGPNVSLVECWSEAEVMDTSVSGGLTTVVWGCSLADVQGGASSFARYVYGGGINASFGSHVSWFLSLGAQINGVAGTVRLVAPQGAYGIQIGDTLIRGTVNLDSNTPEQSGGVANDAFVVWGSGTLNLVGVARLVLPAVAGAAVAAIKCTGGVRLNNQTVANAINPTTGAWSGQIALTPANIDLAFASGGFGGYAINPCGACITKQGST